MDEVFICINTEIGSEKKVKKELIKIKGIKDVYILYGVYDIIAKLQAPSTVKIKEIITKKVRRIKDVRSTLTMIIYQR
jgi:DNA-binding Lrp family transcriptional regulator